MAFLYFAFILLLAFFRQLDTLLTPFTHPTHVWPLQHLQGLHFTR